MNDIFLSYAKEDAGRAQRYVALLESYGWSVWWDREIPVGREWVDVLEEQLESAKCVLVLWSDESVQSRWVNKEARLAQAEGKLAQATIDTVEVPFEFGDEQAADLSDWRVGAGGAFDKLLERVVELAGPATKDGRLQRVLLRNDALAKALLAMLVTGVTLAVGIASQQVFAQPWSALAAVLPLAGTARWSWIAWKRTRDARDLLLQPTFAVFLATCLALFSVVASSDLLTWKRSLSGFETVNEGWKLPASLRDWRYRLIPRAPRAPIKVVDLGGRSEGEVTRVAVGLLIDMASQHNATGVGLDLYFPESSGIDSHLCSIVESASIPVIGGYTFDRGMEGRVLRQPYAETLEGCFGPERRGHLVGYQEGDGRVRSIPLLLNSNVTELQAFSIMIARQMGGEDLQLPEGGLLYMLPPSDRFPVLGIDSLISGSVSSQEIEGHFLIVGKLVPEDEVDTAYGVEAGTVVHANAVHSLLAQRYFRRPPRALMTLALVLAAYLVALLVDRGASARSVFSTVGFLITGLVLSAVAAARIWSSWVDVEYVIAGLLVITLLLLAARQTIVAAVATKA